MIKNKKIFAMYENKSDLDESIRSELSAEWEIKQWNPIEPEEGSQKNSFPKYFYQFNPKGVNR